MWSNSLTARPRSGYVLHRFRDKKVCDRHDTKTFPRYDTGGDVRHLTYRRGVLYGKDSEILYIGKIDVIIGGSPCQDLSSAKAKRRGLKGEKSSLFWEYHRLLREVNPEYFFLENVASMANSERDTISLVLDVEPIYIDSEIISGGHRKRYYWTNIPNVSLPKRVDINFSDLLCEGWFSDRKKARGILRGYSDMWVDVVNEKHILYWLRRYKRRMCNLAFHKNGLDIRLLNTFEMERLQTLPEGYTEHLTWRQAADVIGDGWTVDVVAHIFSFIP